MELMEKILIERIIDAGQLTDAEQERVRTDPALQAAIRENTALARLKRDKLWAPQREAVLRSALNRTANGGHSMSLIERLFTGRRWYFQLGAALLLLAAVTLLALLPRASSWAQTNGYVLKFDFGQVVDPEDDSGVRTAVKDQLADLEAALKDWPRERQPAAQDGKSECEVMVSVNIDNGHMTALVALVDADRAELEDLAEWLAEKPGVPAPQITEATWFHPGGKLDPNAGITFNIMDHQFSFPASATESEIEQTINDWLKENRPEFGGTVDVTINRSAESADGHEDEKVEVMIKVNESPGE
jgi:hypothetical protein